MCDKILFCNSKEIDIDEIAKFGTNIKIAFVKNGTIINLEFDFNVNN